MSAGVRQDSRIGLRRRLLVQLVLDVLVPLVLLYLLRQAGASVWLAAVVGGAIPAARALASLARGRVDVLGLVVLSLFVVGAGVAYLAGDPRIVFAKDGWLTGMLGIWVIVSLWMRRPFMLHLGRVIATVKKGAESAAAWERRWCDEPRFRRDVRLVSWVIGLVLLADAVVRVVIAYTLPLDVVPVATTVQYVVMLAGLLGWFFPYTSKRGLRA
jgi:hypothetical protein